MKSRASAPLSPEILREVKRLHFQTKRLADQGVVGRYRSAFRGTGVEFEEVREYVPGDDVRRIDWKVTARSRIPFVKSYREERELTVIIAVDVSGSTSAGSAGMLRGTLSAKVGALLTLIALTNNDKVGLVTFSDRIESFHPPRKARGAVWRILHEVLAERTGERRSTDLETACRFLNNVLKRRAIVFLISDFICSGYEVSLATLGKRHDVTAVSIDDPRDAELPALGFLQVLDAESGESRLIDTSDPEARRGYAERSRESRETRRSFFRQQGIGAIELRTDEPFLPPLRRFFSIRQHRAQREGR